MIQEIHQSVLFYYFSTVPQVLGAILALMGVFYIVRLDLFKKSIISNSQHIIDSARGKYKSTVYNWYEIIRMENKKFAQSLKNLIENKLKYAQIANDVDEIKRVINQIIKESEKFSFKNEDVSFLIFNLLEYCERIILLNQILTNHKRLIGKVFLSNGLIILLYVIAILAIPCYYQNQGWRLLIIISSIILLVFSLYSMINFISNSLIETVNPRLFDLGIFKATFATKSRISRNIPACWIVFIQRLKKLKLKSFRK